MKIIVLSDVSPIFATYTPPSRLLLTSNSVPNRLSREMKSCVRLFSVSILWMIRLVHTDESALAHTPLKTLSRRYRAKATQPSRNALERRIPHLPSITAYFAVRSFAKSSIIRFTQIRSSIRTRQSASAIALAAAQRLRILQHSFPEKRERERERERILMDMADHSQKKNTTCFPNSSAHFRTFSSFSAAGFASCGAFAAYSSVMRTPVFTYQAGKTSSSYSSMMVPKGRQSC